MAEKIKGFFNFSMFTLKLVIICFAVYGILYVGYQLGIPKSTDNTMISEVESNSFFETVGNKFDSLMGNPPEKIVHTYDENRYVYKLEGEKEKVKENDIWLISKVSDNIGNGINTTKEKVGGFFTDDETKNQ